MKSVVSAYQEWRAAPKVAIPHMVHVIWIGDKPFPYQENLDTWKMNRGWEVKLWTDRNLPRLRHPWIYEALKRAAPVAARADLLRLEILAQYGGLYTDADSWCVKPLAPLVSSMTCFGMTGNKGNIQNATLGAVPRHPAFTTLVDGAAARYLRLAYLRRNTDPGYEIFDLFGTRYITPVLRAFPDFRQVDAGKQKGTRQYMCVQGQDELSRAYIVHANAVSWKKEGGPTRLTLPAARPPHESGLL